MDPVDTGCYASNQEQALINLAHKAAYASAIAEGFFVTDSVPQRCHNPGDLELGDRGWGVFQGKTIFAKADAAAPLDDRTDGWATLRREWIAILTGASLTIPVSFTFEQLAVKWTGGDNPGAWAKIVTEKLMVDPMATVAEWVKSQMPPAAISA